MQVGAGDDDKAIGFEHPLELGQRYRHFMRVKMLDVVAGKQGIDRGIGHAGHIRHGADNVGIDGLVDVEAEFLPVVAVETARGLVLAFGAAADVEEGFQCFALIEVP